MRDYYVGLDLGAAGDYTAVAIIQPDPRQEPNELHLVHLERYPLRTSYTDVADRVAALMRSHKLSGAYLDPMRGRYCRIDTELLVDKTGVVELLQERGIVYTAISITGGEQAHRKGGEWSVPKKDLIAALEVPFHSGKVKVAGGLALWDVLREELRTFRRKQNARTGHVSFEHWRESEHDDLVLAVALACWGARARPEPRIRSL